MLSLLVFTIAFIFFLLHPFGNVFQIIGDNICQIAYWHILFNPHLVGSIGAATAKPGLIFLLGFFYDLSIWLFGSTILIKILLSFFASLLVYAVARLTADMARGFAGIVSALFLISMTPLTEQFVLGTSMVFFLPMLLIGLRFFARGRKRLGIIVLCFAMLLRPEALGAILWLAVFEQLARRRLKEFVFSIFCISVALFIFFMTSYLIQGDLSRLNAGGPDTGYFFTYESTFTMRLGHAIQYVFQATWEIVSKRFTLMYLLLPAFLAILFFPKRRAYLSILGIVIFWIVYLTSGNGDFTNRYFEFLIPFVVAFGWGGVFYVGKKLWIKKTIKSIFVLSLFCVLLYMIIFEINSFMQWKKNFALGNSYAVYTWDAMQIFETQPIPKGSRLLTEDDIIYGIVVRDPNYFRALTALQFFNIKNDNERRKILEATDYILISKAPYHYYYLRYTPFNRGSNDLFRQTIYLLIKDGKRKSVYNHYLTPVINSASWIVLRVDALNYE